MASARAADATGSQQLRRIAPGTCPANSCFMRDHTISTDELALVTGGQFQPKMFREAWYPERLVRNYLDYRRVAPRAGVGAALRWAFEDPVLPYFVRRR